MADPSAARRAEQIAAAGLGEVPGRSASGSSPLALSWVLRVLAAVGERQQAGAGG
jgi:hypothetical protein